jgi:hypothetical protein
MDAYWRFLEENAHRAEVQQLIQREIQNGTIRVIPGPKGIRILPQVTDSGREKPAFAEAGSNVAKAMVSGIV